MQSHFTSLTSRWIFFCFALFVVSALDAAETASDATIHGERRVLATFADLEVTEQDLVAFAYTKPLLINEMGSTEGRASLLRELIATALISLAAREEEGLTADASDQQMSAAVRRFEASHLRGAAPTSEAVRAYYDAHALELGIPPAIRTREIFFPVPEGATSEEREAIRQEALSVHTALRDGADFAELASRHAHTEALRKRGGDHGYLSTISHPYLAEETEGLQVGEVSALREYEGGYRIFQVLGRREGTPAPFEAVEAVIVQTLTDQATLQARAEFFRRYGAEVDVHVTDPVLAEYAWPY